MRKYSDTEETKPSGKGGGPSGKMLQFLKEYGDDRVTNPDTKNEVKIKSLQGPKGKVLQRELFEKWLKSQEKKDSPKKSPAPKKELDPNRFKGVKVKATDSAKPIMEKLGIKDPKDIADMMGFSAIPNVKQVYISPMSDSSLRIEMEGKNIEFAFREIHIKDGKKYIKNDFIKLKDSAPKGTGTKMLYEQAKFALDNGIDYIECSADRWDEKGIVGYYVWARLGYDGNIPDDVKKKLPSSFKKAKKVSDLMKTKEGREWWKENGDTFEAKFDKDSLKILEAYMDASGGKTASKKDQFEESPELTKKDEEILDAIWRNQ